MVSSTSNPRIKNVIKLLKSGKERKNQKAFVVEGIRMFSEIPKEQMLEIFVTEEFLLEHQEIEEYNYEIVTPGVMKEMSDTVTPQGILAVVKMKNYELANIIEKGQCLLFLENIQDPGNLGTMMRTGEAAGIAGLILSKDTVDIYNPKTIRATMGAIFRVPFCYISDIKGTLKELHSNEFTTYAAHLNGTVFYEKDLSKKTCFLIGNEGNGLTNETTKEAMETIKIPMCGKVESLNASMAAGVLMYEAKRQRDCR